MSRVCIPLGAAAIVGLCALLLAAGGCDTGPKLPPTAVTTGLVTLDGKPLPSGEVTFIPDFKKGTTGPVGIGNIDQNGRYQIVTAGREGALVGEHTVRIIATDDTKAGHPWITPEIYNEPERSGLTATVKAGKENTIDFALKSTP